MAQSISIDLVHINDNLIRDRPTNSRGTGRAVGQNHDVVQESVTRTDVLLSSVGCRTRCLVHAIRNLWSDGRRADRPRQMRRGSGVDVMRSGFRRLKDGVENVTRGVLVCAWQHGARGRRVDSHSSRRRLTHGERLPATDAHTGRSGVFMIAGMREHAGSGSQQERSQHEEAQQAYEMPIPTCIHHC